MQDVVAKQPLWDVLRDDFTKGSKLKDWDKTDQKDQGERMASSSEDSADELAQSST